MANREQAITAARMLRGTTALLQQGQRESARPTGYEKTPKPQGLGVFGWWVCKRKCLAKWIEGLRLLRWARETRAGTAAFPKA